MLDGNDWQREYQRKRAQRLQAAGVCIICGQASAGDGLKTCASCRARAAANANNRADAYDRYRATQRAYRQRRREKLIAQGLCTSCGKLPPIAGLMYCTECQEKNRAKKRKRFKAAREQGLCLRCMRAKARRGRNLCLKCALEESERRDVYYWAKKAMKTEVKA